MVVDWIANAPGAMLSTLADEALDIPRLDRIHLVFPQRNPGLVTQQVGRVERKHPDKTDAYIFDYVDSNVGALEAQWKVRRTEVYMPRGYKVQVQRRAEV
jgi:superfamily II DNA or RNA helicase